MRIRSLLACGVLAVSIGTVAAPVAGAVEPPPVPNSWSCEPFGSKTQPDRWECRSVVMVHAGRRDSQTQWARNVGRAAFVAQAQAAGVKMASLPFTTCSHVKKDRWTCRAFWLIDWPETDPAPTATATS